MSTVIKLDFLCPINKGRNYLPHGAQFTQQRTAACGKFIGGVHGQGENSLRTKGVENGKYGEKIK